MSMIPGRNLFAELKEDCTWFIETGSYRGDGIQLAVDAGFDNIISIDNDAANIEFCQSRFDLLNPEGPYTGKIFLFHGDSVEMLPRILRMVRQLENERIMFWLDAHWQLQEGTPKGDNPFPLMRELQAIEQEHQRDDHTILIDDHLILTHPDVTGWTRKDIQSNLILMNHLYKITLYGNPVIDNLLVAKV